MNKQIIALAVGLLALGALEFGMLGASAAGLVGGSGHALPPVARRGIVLETATATATPAVISPGAPYSVELLKPAPDAIECDGSHSSLIHVFVRDSNGNPVKEGTPVRFSVFNGSAVPPSAPTGPDGALTKVVLYSDAYSLQPNVVASVGDLETAIRLRCKPNSGCPLSPPPGVSPPCASPTPTPYPCNPSPGSGPLSPPCDTQIGSCVSFDPLLCIPPTPPSPPRCNPSPGSGSVSPPCASPTPTPYPCNPSPGSGSVSPPCASPTPTPYPCNSSPGGGSVSPPCASPTPTPYPCNPSPSGGNVSPPCASSTPTPYPCNPSPGSGSVSPPCVPPTSTPYPCNPSPSGGNVSPPCATATPIPHCAPFAPSSPPCVPPSPPSPPARCADVTGDGRVTQADVLFVAGNALKRRPDHRADVNGDGRVDWRDVAETARQIGRRCSHVD